MDPARDVNATAEAGKDRGAAAERSVLDLFSSSERELGGVRDLGRAIEALASAPHLAARVEALERLATWVRQSDVAMPWPAGEADPAGGDARYRRLGVLIMIV